VFNIAIALKFIKLNPGIIYICLLSFGRLISDIQVDCVVIRRMGSLSDGGWDVCTVPPYVLEPHCIVYSFG